jgi:two-component system sensor histidine kinase BaeS
MPERHGPPWAQGPWGPRGPGRRFRRGGLVALAILVLVVAGLASLVGAIASGNAPSPGVTIAVATAVVAGIVVVARWFWRTARSIGAVMDAADRVAGGAYETRVGDVPSRQLQRLASAFDEMTARLETNEARRRELLADVAHELRTPLQAIRGQVEGMVDGLYPADAEHLRPVLERTDTMARLLDDLRTVSTAEAGVLQLHRETLDPVVAAERAVEAARAAADRGSVTLSANADADAPRAIDADPVRVDEVLSNLLANAVQHTPAGGRVSVTVAPAAGGVRFAIDDTGPGIAEEDLPHVFERFVTSAEAGGTGLGLAISRRLVEAHGGTIEASRSPGGGTRIRFNLPLG